MNKSILSLFLVLIALTSIASASACDNCTVDSIAEESNNLVNYHVDYCENNTFMPDNLEEYLTPNEDGNYIFPVTYDPVNGILKINPDCPYFDSTDDLKCSILMTNRWYVPNETYEHGYHSQDIDASNGINLLSILKDFNANSSYYDGLYECFIDIARYGVPNENWVFIKLGLTVYVNPSNEIIFEELDHMFAKICGHEISYYTENSKIHL